MGGIYPCATVFHCCFYLIIAVFPCFFLYFASLISVGKGVTTVFVLCQSNDIYAGAYVKYFNRSIDQHIPITTVTPFLEKSQLK